MYTRLVVTLFLLSTLGCGGAGVERHDVSGTATFDGKPIVFGEIEFISRHAEGIEAPSGSATIDNGEYDTSNAGQGIIAGPHEIRVTAYPSKPTHNEDETVEVEPVEPIFVGYSYESEVEPPTFNIEVPGDAEGFNFAESGKQSHRDDP